MPWSLLALLVQGKELKKGRGLILNITSPKTSARGGKSAREFQTNRAARRKPKEFTEQESGKGRGYLPEKYSSNNMLGSGKVYLYVKQNSIMLNFDVHGVFLLT